MREIKFRAWEVPTQNMVYLGELYCWEYGYTGYAPDRKFSGLHEDIGLGRSREEHVRQIRSRSKERFILQQFTGHIDRCGREIYEGDVLDVECGHLLVIWKDGSFYAQGKDPEGRTWGITLTSGVISAWGIRVVGNVYENPEYDALAPEGLVVDYLVAELRESAERDGSA